MGLLVEASEVVECFCYFMPTEGVYYIQETHFLFINQPYIVVTQQLQTLVAIASSCTLSLRTEGYCSWQSFFGV